MARRDTLERLKRLINKHWSVIIPCTGIYEMRRFLTTTSVLLLLVVTWGQVLAASVCPHMQAAHSCCFTKKAEHKQDQAAHHEDMAMGEMSGGESMGMQAAPAAPSSEERVGSIGHPMKDCAPCVDRSPLQTTPVTVSSVDQSKRGVEIVAPLETSLLAPLALASRSLVSSRSHAPPGVQAPRHVLISVFRI